MPKNNEESSAVIIQGPWPKGKKVKLPDQDAIKQQEDLDFANELSETLMIQMIHSMGENGINIQDKFFVRDMGYLLEVVKASIYRNGDFSHPMQQMIESCTELTVEDDDSIHTEVDVKKIIFVLDEIINIIEDKDNDDT